MKKVAIIILVGFQTLALGKVTHMTCRFSDEQSFIHRGEIAVKRLPEGNYQLAERISYVKDASGEHPRSFSTFETTEVLFGYEGFPQGVLKGSEGKMETEGAVPLDTSWETTLILSQSELTQGTEIYQEYTAKGVVTRKIKSLVFIHDVECHAMWIEQ